MRVAGGGERPILNPGDYLSFLEDQGLLSTEGWPVELIISIGSVGIGEGSRVRRAVRRSRSTPWGRLSGAGGGRGHLSTPLMGGAAMASLAELVIEAGTEKIILVGSCGSLLPDHREGEVVVVDSALATEGPSGAYGYGPVVEGSADLAAAVADRLSDLDDVPGSVTLRRSWTVASPFLTTPALRDAAVSAGARVVEMEAASLFAVANRRRTEAVVVGVVADGLGGPQWSAPDLPRTGARLAEVLSVLKEDGS